jgi:hypothetical protein
VRREKDSPPACRHNLLPVARSSAEETLIVRAFHDKDTCRRAETIKTKLSIGH